MLTFYIKFIDHGIVTNIKTNTFEVTRQFELNVGVSDVFLTGLTGGAELGGSLGGLISSQNVCIVLELLFLFNLNL